MRKILKLLLLYLVLLLTSANAKVSHDEQIWANINSFITIKSSLQLYLEVQPRFAAYHSKHETSLYRAAIGKTIGSGFSVWLGYGFIERTFPFHLHEDRPFVQLMHVKEMFGTFKIVNRTRLEGRYFRSYEQPSYRLRHLLRVQYRFIGTDWGLVAYDEFFWYLNQANRDRGIREGFDQNRAFIGLSRYFGGASQHLGEVGYMNQYVNGKFSDAVNHVLAMQLTFKFE